VRASEHTITSSDISQVHQACGPSQRGVFSNNSVSRHSAEQDTETRGLLHNRPIGYAQVLWNIGVPYGSRTPTRRGRRREREAIYGNSKELSSMDSALPHLKDSRERLFDV